MHTIILFVKARRSNCKYIPYEWNTVVEALHRYNPSVKLIKVNWKPPDTGWVKINTDGASKGNSERSSWVFCVRATTGYIFFSFLRRDKAIQTTQSEKPDLRNMENQKER
ncbi:hypothetical protein RDI58_026944 [Solanum bulbocastanum]|uniref:RNase H type-1 domain-containing protein n=1 Tax=Solanum bulbocastanum TaxID=147425 RepID=A0AAN8T1B2_SOLBU